MSEIPQQETLLAMLADSFQGGRGWAYTKDRHSSSDKINLTKEEGEQLVGLGLVEQVTDGTPHYELTSEGVKVLLPRAPDYKPLDIVALIDATLDLDYFHPSDDTGEVAIPALWVPGGPNAKLVLVLGSNAGGKSFFRRLIRLMTHAGTRHRGHWKGGKFVQGPWKVEPGEFPVREMVHISMESRTSGGVVSAMVYGTEDWQSTGENSAHTVEMGAKTSQGRCHPNIMYWDEPDIGMSAASAAGAGLEIKDMLNDLSPLVQAVFVTSHSAPLVAQLVEFEPHYLHLGDEKGPATLCEWLEEQKNPTPVRPSEVKRASTRRYRQIQAILNRRKSR